MDPGYISVNVRKQILAARGKNFCPNDLINDNSVFLNFTMVYFQLPGVAKMFSNEMTLASAWIHLLAVDLYAARYEGIYVFCTDKISVANHCPTFMGGMKICKLCTIVYKSGACQTQSDAYQTQYMKRQSY